MIHIKLFEDKQEKLYREITFSEIDDFEETHNRVNIDVSIIPGFKRKYQHDTKKYALYNLEVIGTSMIEKYTDEWYVFFEGNRVHELYIYLCDGMDGLKQCLKDFGYETP